MSNVAEFIGIREHIESLVQQIAVCAEQKAIPQSKEGLDEAAQLLVRLTGMADNDVQENAVGRLKGALAGLETTVEKLSRKTPVRKRKAVV